jgi:hypothetical protein
MAQTTDRPRNPDANRDPITGTPGAHPVGVGLGAVAGGAATGAAVGSVAGPVGTAIGAAAGAIAGGLAGKGIAEAINPTAEEGYWRDNYATRPYYERGRAYDDYLPAYRTGWEGRAQYGERTFEEVESDLAAQYDKAREPTSVDWATGRHAARDAWDRVDTLPEKR